MQDFPGTENIAEMLEATIEFYRKQQGFTESSRKKIVLYLFADLVHVCIHNRWCIADMLENARAVVEEDILC